MASTASDHSPNQLRKRLTLVAKSSFRRYQGSIVVSTIAALFVSLTGMLAGCDELKVGQGELRDWVGDWDFIDMSETYSIGILTVSESGHWSLRRSGRHGHGEEFDMEDFGVYYVSHLGFVCETYGIIDHQTSRVYQKGKWTKEGWKPEVTKGTWSTDGDIIIQYKTEERKMSSANGREQKQNFDRAKAVNEIRKEVWLRYIKDLEKSDTDLANIYNRKLNAFERAEFRKLLEVNGRAELAATMRQDLYRSWLKGEEVWQGEKSPINIMRRR